MTLRKETGRTLRDELEAKLRKIYFKAETDVFGLLADECIRQMEWARRECTDTSYFDRPGGEYNAPLTLAPEDWKP